MKMLKRVVFILFITMIFINKVDADCTYEERQELLKEANNINAYFEANVPQRIFTFYLYNLSDDLSVEVTNTINDKKITINKNNLTNGLYTYSEFEIDKSGIYTLNIYSNKTNCYQKKITSKRVKKGIINSFANEEVCKGIEEYYYCNQVLDKEITLSRQDVYEKIEDYKQVLEEKNKVVEKEKFSLLKFIKKYWYLFMIFIGIGVGVLIIIFINKSSRE